MVEEGKNERKRETKPIWNNNAHTLIYSYWSNNRFYTKKKERKKETNQRQRTIVKICESDCSNQWRNKEGGEKNKLFDQTTDGLGLTFCFLQSVMIFSSL